MGRPGDRDRRDHGHRVHRNIGLPQRGHHGILLGGVHQQLFLGAHLLIALALGVDRVPRQGIPGRPPQYATRASPPSPTRPLDRVTATVVMNNCPEVWCDWMPEI